MQFCCRDKSDHLFRSYRYFQGCFFHPSNTRSPRNGQDKGTSGHQISSRVNIYICWKLDCVKVSYKYHVWFSSAAVRTMIIFCHRHLYHNHCSPDRRKREKLISSIKMVFRCFQIWNKERKWQDCRIQYFDQMQPPPNLRPDQFRCYQIRLGKNSHIFPGFF